MLTLDEHFGDWTVLPLSHHFGVVRVKADPATSRNVLALMLPFLERAAIRGLAFYHSTAALEKARLSLLKQTGALLAELH